MADKEDENFLKKLLVTFKLEAEEHVQAMSSLLLELEKNKNLPAGIPPVVEKLFREAHSLKGAARAVNHASIEAVCQALESVLAALKRQELSLSTAFFDVFYRTLDYLSPMIHEELEVSQTQVSLMVAALEQLQLRAAGAAPMTMLVDTAMDTNVEETVTVMPAAMAGRAVPTGNAAGNETIRISTAKLGDLMTQAEELLTLKFSADHMVGELHTLRDTLVGWKKEWGKTSRDFRTLRRPSDRGSDTVNKKNSITTERLLDAIERNEVFVKTLTDRVMQLERMAEQEKRSLTGMVDALLEDMKKTLMLPFSSLLEMFPKMVRDLAHDNAKEVDLVVDGSSIEIDRRILEILKDPLIHLIRNSIDHGIESPVDRVKNGKARRGKISIDVTPIEGNKVELLIRDDGAGVDADRVKVAAQKLGLIAEDANQKLSQLEILNLLFESGMSTSPILTDMSGRGLGLAIVREKVEKLGGSIEIESLLGSGTCFRVLLPTTLATFRGLLIALGDAQFVLPSRNVERVVRVPRELIKTVENRETIEYEGQAVAFIPLADVLVLRQGAPVDTDYVVVAVLAAGGKRIAFAVDAVLADQEVLVKGLGPQLMRLRNIAGVTILGAGRVVPILNVSDLFKSALLRASVSRSVRAIDDNVPSERLQHSLLVVEDSITSRSLLKNILEAADYRVITAVDGVDAWSALCTENFDLVVSDIEMPRMDGFDLTQKIRSDNMLANLPVVLVTSLDSREHKERGIDVGANAYIVKSSFDQSNLLEVIRRLV